MAGYLNSQGVSRSTLTTTLLNTLDLGDSLNPTLIDTVPGVAEVVDSLEGLPVEPPSIYIDLEGVNLSRIGTISILQVYIHTTKQVYLIDVLTLRDKCFSTCGESGRTLKDIFESSTIPKVFFDVRNDSDALYHHFQINLAGVLDLQLMELATRNSNRRLVSGLSKCIERDAPLSATERRSWMQIKDKGVQLFNPENGGSYAVFNERPLREDISLYCTQDVQILPRLWAHYSSKITPAWKLRVNSVSKERVEQSQSPSYNGKGRHMALAPAGW
ncbi:ribonuclease H-like domain-containing protein [Trichoderma evansii]